MVRLSVVASSRDVAPDFPFSYREQFKYRWTENYLLSSLLSLLGSLSRFRAFLESFRVEPRPKMCAFAVAMEGFPDCPPPCVLQGSSQVQTKFQLLDKASRLTCQQRTGH